MNPQTHPYSLTNLLEGVIKWPKEHSLAIKGLSSDSRETRPGELFIAYAGPKAERAQFIAQAVKNGAVAVLQASEQNSPYVELQDIAGQKIPVGYIPHLNEKVGLIAARFYHYPANSLTCIGVTGTNGKTSCTQFMARAMEGAAVIGTLGSGFPDHITPGTLTTPDPINLQKTIAELKAQHATHLFMEVSSHSLVQHRVAGIPFKIAVFTNLTRDHLDYHGDMKSYGQAKRLLFLTPGLQYAVINADDAFGCELLNEFKSKLTYYAYTLENNFIENIPTISASNLQFHSHGFSAHIDSPWGSSELHSPLLGRFNLSNLLATLTTLCLLDVPFADALQQLSTLSTVPGRMQTLGGGNKPTVIVDYSHKPDALEKVLSTLREHTSGKLWCVFGCGGNRDTGKRPMMGKIASTLSDHVIITNDNPRFEDPNQIIAEILAGVENVNHVTVEPDRQTAIASAIQQAKAGDIILVAGKGHETYQQIGETKIHFNDAEIVEEILKNKKI